MCDMICDVRHVLRFVRMKLNSLEPNRIEQKGIESTAQQGIKWNKLTSRSEKMNRHDRVENQKRRPEWIVWHRIISHYPVQLRMIPLYLLCQTTSPQWTKTVCIEAYVLRTQGRHVQKTTRLFREQETQGRRQRGHRESITNYLSCCLGVNTQIETHTPCTHTLHAHECSENVQSICLNLAACHVYDGACISLAAQVRNIATNF